jgi:thiol-disulfide isomerase/thioredoxin
MKKLVHYIFLLGVFTPLFLFGQAPTNPGYQMGDRVEDFSLKGVDGKMHSLSENKNVKGYIVVFTCNTCPFSKAYERRVIDLHLRYAKQGMPVIAINPNDPGKEPGESYEAMVALAKEKQYPFVYLQDTKQLVATMFGAKRTPHVFLLNQNKELIYVGAIDDNFEEPEQVKVSYLANAINQYLMGMQVEISQTKAIGCGIKWRNK